jgi:hypothetical protein
MARHEYLASYLKIRRAHYRPELTCKLKMILKENTFIYASYRKSLSAGIMQRYLGFLVVCMGGVRGHETVPLPQRTMAHGQCFQFQNGLVKMETMHPLPSIFQKVLE